MPSPPANVACRVAASLLALAPVFDCAARQAMPVSTRQRAQRARVERVAPPARVAVRRARLAQAPLESMAARRGSLARDALAPGLVPGPTPTLFAGGRAVVVERAVFAGGFALVRTGDDRIVRVGFDDLDALLLDGEVATPRDNAIAAFPGGARIVGSLAIDGDRPAVVHPVLGRFDLTGVGRLTLRESVGAGILDEPGVALVNGDAILGEPTLLREGVAIGLHDRSLLLPWSRVAEVALDAGVAPSARCVRAHLADGTIVEARSIVTRPGRENDLDLTLASGGTVRLGRSALVGVTRAGVEIASLRPSPTLEAHKGALLARSGAHDLALPTGAGLVRGVIALPSSARRWGAAYITLWSGREPIFFARLDAEHPGAPFAVRTTGPLLMTVHPGRFGTANAVAEVRANLVTLAED